MTTYILKKECRNIGKERGDYYNGEYGESPEKIQELIDKGIIEEDVCEFCQGTGEVEKVEPVYQGEPHMAATDTQKCVCQYPDTGDDEYDQDR